VFVLMLHRKMDLSDYDLLCNLQLDDWVLCRIYNKKGKIEKFNTSTTPKVQNYYEHEEVEEHEMKPEIQKLGNYQLYMDTSDSVPKLHTDSSSSGGHVVSPDVTCDREVQSEPKWNDLGIQLDDAFDFQLNYLENALSFDIDDDPFGTNQYQINQLSPLQDIFMYPQKPF